MSEYVSISIKETIHVTSDAYLICFGDFTSWVPKSQIDMAEFDPYGDEVLITGWFARKEGLIDT